MAATVRTARRARGARVNTWKVAAFLLFVATFGLAALPPGPARDGALAGALLLAVFTGAHRAWQASHSGGGSGGGGGGGGNGASPAWQLLVSAASLTGLVLAVTLAPSAPRAYVLLAGAPAFFSTFHPVLARIVPGHSSTLCSACTLSLLGGLYAWPGAFCGAGIVYVCFVTQVVAHITFDRFSLAVLANVTMLLADVVPLLFGVSLQVWLLSSAAAVSGAEEDAAAHPWDTGHVNVVDGPTRIVPAGTGLIWKSLKDIAAVGTLFPVLIAFDLRQSGKDGHSGTTGYFATAFGAFAATLIVAQAVGADRFDIPLSVYATPTVLFAVGLRARCLGDVGTLLSFNAGSFGKLSHRH